MVRPHTFRHGPVAVTFVMNTRASSGIAKAGDREIPLEPEVLLLDKVPEQFHEALRELHNQLFSPRV
jgi:hypothetical protein